MRFLDFLPDPIFAPDIQGSSRLCRSRLHKHAAERQQRGKANPEKQLCREQLTHGIQLQKQGHCNDPISLFRTLVFPKTDLANRVISPNYALSCQTKVEARQGPNCRRESRWSRTIQARFVGTNATGELLTSGLLVARALRCFYHLPGRTQPGIRPTYSAAPRRCWAG